VFREREHARFVGLIFPGGQLERVAHRGRIVETNEERAVRDGAVRR